jgi:hypothetical protein
MRGSVLVGCISRRDRRFLEGCNFDHPFLRGGGVSTICWTGSGVFGV